jgi:hypothetical protein
MHGSMPNRRLWRPDRTAVQSERHLICRSVASVRRIRQRPTAQCGPPFRRCVGANCGRLSGSAGWRPSSRTLTVMRKRCSRLDVRRDHLRVPKGVGFRVARRPCRPQAERDEVRLRLGSPGRRAGHRSRAMLTRVGGGRASIVAEEEVMIRRIIASASGVVLAVLAASGPARPPAASTAPRPRPHPPPRRPPG